MTGEPQGKANAALSCHHPICEKGYWRHRQVGSHPAPRFHQENLDGGRQFERLERVSRHRDVYLKIVTQPQRALSTSQIRRRSAGEPFHRRLNHGRFIRFRKAAQSLGVRLSCTSWSSWLRLSTLLMKLRLSSPRRSLQLALDQLSQRSLCLPTRGPRLLCV